MVVGLNGLGNGWHILSSYGNVTLSSIGGLTGYKIIWNYQNGKWGAYSANGETAAKIKEIKDINLINGFSKYNAFWVGK